MKDGDEPRLTLKNVRRHFRTINSHRYLVFKHCCRCGLFWQGLFHDLSKYSPQEFWVGARYYQGDRSPNDAERRVSGASSAWMHHKGRNKHHFEYWNDINPASKRYEPVEMPVRYLIEMFCDRVAASKIYRGDAYVDRDPLDYFLRGMKNDRPIHPKTAKQLEKLLRMLAEQGEEKTFAYIRHIRREAKKRGA